MHSVNLKKWSGHVRYGSAHRRTHRCLSYCINRPPCGCSIELGDLTQPCPKCAQTWEQYDERMSAEYKTYCLRKMLMLMFFSPLSSDVKGPREHAQLLGSSAPR